MTPSTKVSAATLAAALGALLVWAAQQFAGLALPPAVQGALVVLLTFGCGWLVPEQHPAPSAVAAIQAQERRR